MILFVCEANICRSPLAAGLVMDRLAALEQPVNVESAGVAALVGEPVDAGTASIAHELGIDLSAHRARQLDQEQLARAHLVLTATRRVRGAAVQLHAPAVQYTFTLRQFGRILASAGEPFVPDPERTEDQVEQLRHFAAKHRGLQAPPEPAADDIIDPFKRAASAHEQALREMSPALRQLLSALGADRSPEPSHA